MSNPTMPCASHHWTFAGAWVGANPGAGVVLAGWTRLNRLGLHCRSEIRNRKQQLTVWQLVNIVATGTWGWVVGYDEIYFHSFLLQSVILVQSP